MISEIGKTKQDHLLPQITAYREFTSCSLEREIQEEFSNSTQVRKRSLECREAKTARVFRKEQRKQHRGSLDICLFKSLTEYQSVHEYKENNQDWRKNHLKQTEGITLRAHT